MSRQGIARDSKASQGTWRQDKTRRIKALQNKATHAKAQQCKGLQGTIVPQLFTTWKLNEYSEYIYIQSVESQTQMVTHVCLLKAVVHVRPMIIKAAEFFDPTGRNTKWSYLFINLFVYLPGQIKGQINQDIILTITIIFVTILFVSISLIIRQKS